jgi:O-antigen/teichoic acid export membrane protein
MRVRDFPDFLVIPIFLLIDSTAFSSSEKWNIERRVHQDIKGTKLSKARGLLRGTVWLYGAQFITIAFQFFYAAFTSRIVDAQGFGAYAAALTVVGLASLLAMGGLGQSIARMECLGPDEVRPLVAYALMLGLVSFIFLFVSGSFWAWLWGIEALIHPLRWLTLSALISPLLGLSLGLAGRLGKFRKIASITLASNVAGMIAGAVAVSALQSAASLTASTITAQVLTLSLLLFTANDKLLFRKPSLRHGKTVLLYSRRITGTSFLSYLTGNIVKFSLGRTLDIGTLGQLNRAEVLTSIPLQQMQSALVRTVYPEFRHDIRSPDRANRVWTDMMILVAWVSLSISACMAVIVPALVPLLFGAGWDTAAQLIAPLAIAGGIQVMSTLLASALEALARFRWIFRIECILILVQVAGVGLLILLDDPLIVAYILIFTGLTRHAIQIVLLGRAGYLRVRRLLANYIFAAVFACFAAAVVRLGVFIFATPAALTAQLLLLGLTAVMAVLVVYILRSKLPVFVIARRYKFF